MCTSQISWSEILLDMSGHLGAIVKILLLDNHREYVTQTQSRFFVRTSELSRLEYICFDDNGAMRIHRIISSVLNENIHLIQSGKNSVHE